MIKPLVGGMYVPLATTDRDCVDSMHVKPIRVQSSVGNFGIGFATNQANSSLRCRDGWMVVR